MQRQGGGGCQSKMSSTWAWDMRQPAEPPRAHAHTIPQVAWPTNTDPWVTPPQVAPNSESLTQHTPLPERNDATTPPSATFTPAFTTTGLPSAMLSEASMLSPPFGPPENWSDEFDFDSRGVVQFHGGLTNMPNVVFSYTLEDPPACFPPR